MHAPAHLGKKPSLHDQMMESFSKAHEWRPNNLKRYLNSSGRAQNNLEEVIGIPIYTYKRALMTLIDCVWLQLKYYVHDRFLNGS